MTRRRWIADEVYGDRAALTGAHAEHLSRVLRVRVGQEFDIAAGETVRRGRIVAIRDSRVEFELGEQLESEHLPKIILLLSIFKFDRLEWAIEKCTELGVFRIVPVVAHRTDRHLAAASEKRLDRWQRVARQASEQSRRTQPPEIAAPCKLRDALHISATLRIVLAESEQQQSLAEILASHASGGELALAVGPEGGWTAEELEMFAGTSWLPVSLGPTILRAETAAIAAVAIATANLP